MKRKLAVVIFTILIVNFVCVFFLFKSTHTFSIQLNGNEREYVSYNTEYYDKGFVIYNKKRIVSNDESEFVIKSNVDSKALGEYKVEYQIRFQGKEYNFERIVEVVDNVGPEITTDIESVEKSYCDGKLVTNLEFKAIDDFDGDVTSKVEKEELEDKIVLKVTDSHNNTSTKELPIVSSDKPANKITLNGSSTQTVGLNGNYTEQGAYVSDGCGNKIDGEEVNIEGSVDTTKEGKYTITYTSKNDSSLKATRIVSVYNIPAAQTAPVTGNSIIYLTFDDGPCFYTKKILDILDKYNIKATFFVTNQISGYQNMIAEEAKRGHTVGIHTLTHKWNIYNSLDSYWNDFNAMNDIVEKQTGKKATILRFPGGTSNHMAKIPMSTIVNSVNAKGYKYYDWNVCVEDAGSCVSSSNKGNCVYNYFVNGLKPGRDNIVLLHDLKSYTADNLERMIQYALNKGYKFKAIDDQTAEVHFRAWK